MIRTALATARRRFQADRAAFIWFEVERGASWCRACHGQGFLDEQAAADLGIELQARTETCWICRGSGAGLGVRLLSWVAGISGGLAGLITTLKGRPL